MIRSLSSRLLLGTAGVLALSVAFAGPVEDAQRLIKDGKFDEAIALLEKADQKKPSTTTALAQAHMAKADAFMNNEQLRPAMRYTTALREYRKVLVYDKTNAKAQQNVKMIEDIYKSMGREVPK